MSTLLLETREPELRIVDLDTIRPSELEGFFRRALESGGVLGKAIRCGSSTAAYGYFLVESGRGVLTGLAVGPEWRGKDVGPLLVRAMIRELAFRGVSRIESQFLSFEAPWLVPCFVAEGFESFVREFRRLPLRARSSRAGESPGPHPSASRT